MKKDDCIFCKLANGDIPTNSIYEDDKFNVILDAGPATKGHALILPKEHFDNVFEIPEEWIVDVALLSKKLATKMKAKLNCDGFNFIQNNGLCAGQTVFHYHYHLIPRYENDGQDILWRPTEPDAKAQEELCKLLKED